jgi:hypothetical protein
MFLYPIPNAVLNADRVLNPVSVQRMYPEKKPKPDYTLKN